MKVDRADQIARDLGFTTDHPDRIRAAVYSVFRDINDNGDIYGLQQSLCELAAMALRLPHTPRASLSGPEQVRPALRCMSAERLTVIANDSAGHLLLFRIADYQPELDPTTHLIRLPTPAQDYRLPLSAQDLDT